MKQIRMKTRCWAYNYYSAIIDDDMVTWVSEELDKRFVNEVAPAFGWEGREEFCDINEDDIVKAIVEDCDKLSTKYQFIAEIVEDYLWDCWDDTDYGPIDSTSFKVREV